MKKIVYFVLLFFVLVFISGYKNESQTEKTQKQQTIEKKTTGIDICKRKETTKLHLAAKNSNDPEEIIALIKDGADINACDSEGKMPIHVYTEPPIELFIDKKPPLNLGSIMIFEKNSKI